MPQPTKLTAIAVFWEQVPDPDPEALKKAFRMLFQASSPLEPDRLDKACRYANVHNDSDN